MAITLYQNNDQIITLQGITNAQGTAVTGATITGVINDRTGASVANGSMTFGDVAGSPGTYEGNVTAAFSPAVATTYTLVVSGSHLGASFTFQTGVSVAVRAI
jgi:hypothetical protein